MQIERGTLILALGIASLVLLSPCFPFGIAAGFAAWLMGRSDLQRMEQGKMDDSSRSFVRAGSALGLATLIVAAVAVPLAIVLGGFAFLFNLLFFLFAF